MNVNKKYKDSLFVNLFNNKRRLLELYSAIKKRVYPVETKIEINTLTDALFMDRINDVSFIMDDKLVILIEYQSTINLNMPLRFLLYISRIYEKIIDNKAIYKKRLVKIPRPEFIVLYNGKDEFPEYEELKLSDAFIGGDKATELELIAKIYNINLGYNKDILKQSKTLNDYVLFISRVKNNIQKNKIDLTDAIKEAVQYCVNEGIMAEFLKEYGAEVINMLFTEFNLEDAIEVAKEEGFEEGREQGLEKGIEKGRGEGALEKAIKVAKKAILLNLPIEDIIELTELTVHDIEKLKHDIK